MHEVVTEKIIKGVKTTFLPLDVYHASFMIHFLGRNEAKIFLVT